MAKNLKKIIPFLMLAILATGGIFFFYTMSANRRMPAASSPEVQEIDEAQLEDITPMTDPGKTPPDFQVILRRHLFGKLLSEKKPATGEPPPPVRLAATSLDLTLLGTITGAPARRRAIILDKKKKGQEIYGQGDTIQGSLIKEIQRDKIILTVNGKDEVLLPETPQKAQTRPQSFRPAQLPAEPPVTVDNPDTPDAEAIEPEALEPPTEPSETVESAESPPVDTVEPVEKEPGNLPPVRRNPQPPSNNKK
jgi:type II secretory pathway component PulC